MDEDQENIKCGVDIQQVGVVNKIPFFKVNLFGIELPSEVSNDAVRSVDTLLQYRHGVGAYTANLGIPIGDVFPHLLPEFSTKLFEAKPKEGADLFKFREYSGVYLPAASVNKQFVPGGVIEFTNKSKKDQAIETADGERVAITPPQMGRLESGNHIDLMHRGKLFRVVPTKNRDEFPDIQPKSTQSTIRRIFSTSITNVDQIIKDYFNDLSDSQYFAICDLVSAGEDFPLPPSLPPIATQEKIAKACKSNSRYAKYQRLDASRVKLFPPRYEIGLVSEFEQEWTSTGYSRGALVSSITLAPEEEMTIEVFTWDRSKLEQERTDTEEHEQTIERSSLSRISSNLSASFGETAEKSIGLSLGIPLPIGNIPVNASGEVDASESIKNDVSSTVDHLNETTIKTAEKFKSSSQIKISQTRETGIENRVTRKLRNPNRGRTLTMQCFEVMEHFEVTTRLLRADKFVLLVEVPQPKSFTINFILAHEPALKRALQDTGYLTSFEAAKKLLAQKYFDERSTLKVEIEEAQRRVNGDEQKQAEAPLITVAKQLRSAFLKCTNLDLVADFGTLARSYLPFGKVAPSERAKAESSLGIFNYWVKFKAVTPGIETRVDSFLAETSAEPTEAEVYRELGSLIAGLDDDWLSTAKMIAAKVVLVQMSATLLIPFPWLAPVLLEFAFIENDLGIPALLNKAKREVTRYEAAKPAVAATAEAEAGKVLVPPPQLFSLQELALADAEVGRLLLHLEAYRVYYMNSIFAALDPNERYQILVGLGIHERVQNTLLGFVGERAIFPLEPASLEKEAKDYLTDRILGKVSEKIGPDINVEIAEIDVPTSGLHMEPVLGKCDALEPYIALSRELELQSVAARLERLKDTRQL